MYLPKAFAETRVEILTRLIQENPLGLLISQNSGEVDANLLPLEIHETEAGLVLRGHLAKANPLAAHVRSGSKELLVVFQGPQAYVTPSFYATKAEDQEVVPTWNYTMVQVRGRATLHDDPDWILAQVGALTKTHETKRALPWHLSDAPEEFVNQLTRALVGIEIAVSSIEGKFKMSQNQPAANQASVQKGFEREGNLPMANLVKGYR